MIVPSPQEFGKEGDGNSVGVEIELITRLLVREIINHGLVSGGPAACFRRTSA